MKVWDQNACKVWGRSEHVQDTSSFQSVALFLTGMIFICCDEGRTVMQRVKFQADWTTLRLFTVHCLFHGECPTLWRRHGHALRLLQRILITFAHQCLFYQLAKFHVIWNNPLGRVSSGNFVTLSEDVPLSTRWRSS